MLLCAASACKKVDVSFTCTPEQPRAGQAVRFNNLSSSGEDWEWTFGDGTTSTLKSPSHTYKAPGTYRVILKVDKKKSLTATREITVFDTVPALVVNDSVFAIYKDYTFTAQVYNPYNYEVTYTWEFPDSVVTCTGETLKGYFVTPRDSAEVKLNVSLNGKQTEITSWLRVQDSKTNSLLLRTPQGDYRQRIFSARAEAYRQDASATPLLDAEQDTMQTYNGYVFRLSELRETFPELQGFHIANRKIYYRAGGLWVAHIDGANPVQIDTAECTAMTLDTEDNRIYWANRQGVWYMPFIGSDNNRFVTIPACLNPLAPVTKLSADTEKK